VIRAAGALLWRESSELKIEIALIHRPRYDDWSLPKGKIEEGESSLRCAFREVIEETGITPQFGRELGSVEYKEPAGLKRVKYWAAKALTDEFLPNEEVDEIKWLNTEDALSVATHESDRSIIENFLTQDPRTDTLIIVRHTKALERGDWDDDDSKRTLDERGVVQSEQLIQHLEPFGIDEIYSSDYIRCIQTVTPLAQSRGLKITEIPNLNEENFELDPERAISFVNAVKQDEKNILICSHNPVIPTMLRGILNTKLKNKDLIKLEPGDAWIVHRVRGEIVGLDFLAIS
jgi:8-oxo-dGTP diphosphatase